MSRHSKVMNDDYNKCLHDIRNSKKLTTNQIAYIRKLSSEDKMEIILTYDLMIEALVDAVISMDDTAKK